MSKKIYFLFFLLSFLLLSGASCIKIKGKSSGFDGGVFRSSDKANSWQQKVLIATVKAEKPNIAGVDVVNITLDPEDHRALYLGTANNGLFFSYDGGESWQNVSQLSTGQISAVAVDPKNKCTIYAASGNKIFQSLDCSRVWQNIYFETRIDQVITSLVIDSYDPRRVYAGLSGGELLQSADAGKSWRVLNRFKNKIKKIVLADYDTRIIYIGTENQGIFKSSDAGQGWTELKDSLKNYPGALEFKNLLLDSKRRDTLILISKYGLLKTADGGSSWQPINLLTPPNSTDIYASALNPQNSNEIYYGTISTIYKTVDGGQNWVAKKLPTSRGATVLLVDPVDPNIIYMGVTKFKK